MGESWGGDKWWTFTHSSAYKQPLATIRTFVYVPGAPLSLGFCGFGFAFLLCFRSSFVISCVPIICSTSFCPIDLFFFCVAMFLFVFFWAEWSCHGVFRSAFLVLSCWFFVWTLLGLVVALVLCLLRFVCGLQNLFSVHLLRGSAEPLFRLVYYRVCPHY